MRLLLWVAAAALLTAATAAADDDKPVTVREITDQCRSDSADKRFSCELVVELGVILMALPTGGNAEPYCPPVFDEKLTDAEWDEQRRIQILTPLFQWLDARPEYVEGSFLEAVKASGPVLWPCS